MSKPKISVLKKIISSKYLFFLLTVFLIIALIYLVKEINYRQLITKELDYLKEQIEETSSENQTLIDNLEETKIEYSKEKAARLNLGLQKEGERTIVVVPIETGFSLEEVELPYSSNSFNFKTWWDYFFKKHSR